MQKSEIPVSIVTVFLKDRGRFVRSQSIDEGFPGFFRYLGSLIRLGICNILQNSFKQDSDDSVLKSISIKCNHNC